MSSEGFIAIPDSAFGGAVAVNVFAILSTAGLVSVALRLTWVAIQLRLRRGTAAPQEYVFFNTQLGQYAACLIIAMIFNTTAGMIGVAWLAQRGVTDGIACRAQAVIMQIGSWAAGYFTVAIAIHTFNSLVLKRRQSPTVCRTVIGAGWVTAILTAGAPFLIRLPEGYVYGADGLACGVRSVYPKLQFIFHLLPILLASILSVVMYSVVFLILRGTLHIKGRFKVTLNPEERWKDANDRGENYNRFIARVAKSMLWYPVAYVALLVPYATVRFLAISGFNPPFQALVFAAVCWYTLGIADVLLLYNTFRVLGPAFDATISATTVKGVESFGSTEKGEYGDNQWRRRDVENHAGDDHYPSTLSPGAWAQNRQSDSSLSVLKPYIHQDRFSSTESTLSIIEAPVVISPGGRYKALSPPPAAVSPFPVSPTLTDFSAQFSNEDVAPKAPVARPVQRLNSVSSNSGPGGLPSSPRVGSTPSRQGSVSSVHTRPSPVAVNFSRPLKSSIGATSSTIATRNPSATVTSPTVLSPVDTLSPPSPAYSRGGSQRSGSPRMLAMGASRTPSPTSGSPVMSGPPRPLLLSRNGSVDSGNGFVAKPPRSGNYF